MASQTTEEILKFVVKASGNESLTPIVRTILDLSGNSAEAEQAVGDLLTQLSDSQKLSTTLEQYKKVGASVRELSARYDETRLKVAELGKGLSATEAPTKKQQQEFERARSELAKLEKQYDTQLEKLRGYKSELSASGIATNSFGRAQSQIREQVTGVTTALQGLETQAREAQAAQAALAAASIAAANAEAAAAKKLAEAQAAATAALAAEQAEAEKRLSVSERQAIRAAVAAERLARATGAVSTEQQTAAAKSSILSGAWSKLATVGAALAGYLSLNAAVTGVKNLLGLADATEKTKIRLDALYGSADAGQKAFESLRALALATGVEFAATAEAAAKLKSFGVEPLNGSLEALINQNARVGGSQETLNGLILAVGQAWAKQKLQGEEILQLVERGVPVWDLLSKATGKNVLELQKLSEAGKLGRTEIAALVREIGASAEGAAAQNLGTFGGLITQIKDQWQQFLLAVADAGVLDYAKQQITALLEEGKKLAADGSIVRYAQATASALTSVAGAIGGAVKLAYEYSGALIFVGKSLVALKFGQLLVDLGNFSLRMKTAAVDAVAMATATGTASTRIGALAAAAKSIPTSIKLAVIAVGVESTISNLIKIYDLKQQIDAEDKKRIGAQELSSKLEDEINAKIAANLAQYSQYANVAIRSQEELSAATRAQSDEYRKALDGARIYYNTLEVQAKRTGNALALTEAREKLKQLEVALAAVNTAVITVAESNRKAAVGITEFARGMVREFLAAKDAGADAAAGLQGAFDKLDLMSGSGLRDAISAIKSIGNISAEAGLVLEDELRTRLAKLSGQDFAKVKKAAAEAFAEGSEGAKRLATAIDGINLARLGVDISEIKTGFSDAGRQAIDSFKGATEEVERLGLTAEQQSAAIAQAFDSAFARAGTRPELEALRAQLNAAFSDGKISAAEYEAKLAQLNAKLDELANKTAPAAAGVREVAGAMREAAAAADDAASSNSAVAESFGNIDRQSSSVAVSLGNMTEEFTRQALAAAGASTNADDYVDTWNRFVAQAEQEDKRLADRIDQLNRQNAALDEEAQLRRELELQYGTSSTRLEELFQIELKLLRAKKERLQAGREEIDQEKELQALRAGGINYGSGNNAQTGDSAAAAGSSAGRGGSTTVELVLRNETNASGETARLSTDQLDQLARTVIDALHRDMNRAGR